MLLGNAPHDLCGTTGWQSFIILVAVHIKEVQKYPTQAHWKYVSLHTFLQQRNYVPCSTFHGSFKVKCPESGAKTHV